MGRNNKRGLLSKTGANDWKYSQKANHKSLSKLLARRKDKPTKGQTFLPM